MCNDFISCLLATSSDYKYRELKRFGVKLYLIYNDVLCDSTKINEIILKRLVKFKRRDFNNIDNLIPNCNSLIIKKDAIIHYLNNGFLILIYKDIYAFEVKNILDRGISQITSELNIGGSKDAFNENIKSNLGLIRKRIKNDLISKSFTVGRISETNINLLYIDSVCDEKLIDYVTSKINDIDIDGIIDCSYLKNAFEDKYNIFPTVIISERVDKSCMALLEGKVILLVDNSPYAVILPCFLNDFFHTTDDYYQKSINTTFIRLIRLISFIIAIFTPAIYLSVTTRNYNLVPTDLLLMLKAGRTFVPFSAFIEALFMIICFEILKESDLRMSTTTGSAVSILGGLILGDAAVSAGIVSPIMIIVIAISSIAGLIFSSAEFVNALRFYKILLLILSSLFGIYGVIFGCILLIYNIFNIKSCGFNYYLFDYFDNKNDLIKRRNPVITNNIIRGRYR